MPISKKYRNNPEIKKALADAWLNIKVDENSLPNPLDWPAVFSDKPEQYITWVMSQPDYFYFVCSQILKVELSPTQCVVIKELWNRKFPMYIATRGFGKAVSPETKIRVQTGWRPIKELGPGDKVYGGDGKLCNVTGATHIQNDLDFYRLTFKDGRTFECCKDHQWKVWDVTKRQWCVKTTIEMFQNFFWDKQKPNRKSPHREYRYAIPLNGTLLDSDFVPPLFFPANSVECSEYRELTFNNKEQQINCQHIYLSRGCYVETSGNKLRIYDKDKAKSAEAKSKIDKVFICDIEYIGKQDGMCIMVDSPDNTYVAENYIVTHNSFLLSVYALLRLMFMPKRKIIIAGSAFRQSKIIFEYMENIYNNAPLLRDLFGSKPNGPAHENDMYRFRFGEAAAIAIPIGNGEKIRGLRANDLIVDEFNSINRDLFETVLVGFTAVSASPLENQKKAAAEKVARAMGWWEDDVFDTTMQDNQLIISGTAGYSFQPFYKYWKDWHDIVTSGGNRKKLENYFQRRAKESGMDATDILKFLNPNHYSIIRIPIGLIPEGFMDVDSVARARATMHSGTYDNEYGAVFSDDSNGFFKRSLIEKCTVKQDSPDFFEAILFGDLKKRYVFGVDPASEVDKFAIFLIEISGNKRRIVYGWTINKKQHREEIEKGVADEQDYYSYCARKIRNLMKRFPCIRIMMDSQGGGYAIMEQFRDTKKLEPGEFVLLPVVDPDKPQDTDMMDGLHIVELVNFRDNKWTSDANHGLRLDFETGMLLFPYFDALSIGRAEYFDDNTSHIYDSLEDCSMEIQELKDELANIIMSKTPTGQDKWDTPEEVQPGGKKGRMRKDRYSAILMANMGARTLMETPMIETFESVGGWSGSTKQTEGNMYSNPFFSDWAADFYKNY